eukprot:5311843-Ditylum_brightwellii.AAC.1
MGLVVRMTFLQVTLQGVLECLHPAKDLGLVVPITNAFTHVIYGYFIPIRAKGGLVRIQTPGECIDGFVVYNKARMCAPFNRALH